MNHFTNRQVIGLCILSIGFGAVFTPPLKSVAQPPETASTAPDPSETPQPLATPPATDSASPVRSTRAVAAITGQGTAGYISKFTGPNAIGNSAIFENGGKIGIGTTAPTALLSIKGTAANIYPFYALNASTGNAIFGSSNGGIGIYGLHSDATGDPAGVSGATNSTSANAVGVMGTVSSTSPGATSAGVRGISKSTGANGFGVLGTHAGLGTGVYGISPNGNGVLGDSTSAAGVRGRHTLGSGTAPGVSGETNSTSPNATGAQGIVNSTNPGSSSAGLRGINNGTGSYGYGIYGSQAGSGIGVSGITPSGTGVRGQSTSGTGVYGISTDGNGVYGISTSAVGVYGYSSSDYGTYGYSYSSVGVFGQSYNSTGVYGASTNGNAGYFKGDVVVEGDLQVTGTLSKGAGSFKIDHPQHPATEYLSHSFVESPDMMNVYNGNTTTNSKGEVWVKLPTYFNALNRDFRYQLTPIGQFAQVIVGHEIQGNHFQIKTDKPNVRVSWQVTGIRNDAYARQHRIRVEEVKTGSDRGRYLYPAGFGFGKDKQIGSDTSRIAKR